MKVFFDTEFTHLHFNIENDMKLISAGFVAEIGSELYVELIDNYQKSDCSHFVIEAVLPHLNSAKYGLHTVKAAFNLKEWIEAFNEPVYMASNSPNHDWPLVMDLLLDHKYWPKNLDGKALNVGNYLTQQKIETYFTHQPMAIRHHALWDARALAAANKG